jgi:hypothetical protein
VSTELAGLQNVNGLLQVFNSTFNFHKKKKKYSRTNVVQSLIARRITEPQLFMIDGSWQRSSFFCSTAGAYMATTNDYEAAAMGAWSGNSPFQMAWNRLWAENGDAISIIYAGTGALKSAYTRTGKRTLVGLVDDARKSAARFYLNNFTDKDKQTNIDLLLGKLPTQREVYLFNPIIEAVSSQMKRM